jgi:flagellar biosynthetic protein FliP
MEVSDEHDMMSHAGESTGVRLGEAPWKNLLIVAILLAVVNASHAQEAMVDAPEEAVAVAENLGEGVQRLAPPDLQQWFGPDRITNTMSLFLLMTVLTLAPTIVIMTTSFVRIIIVLSITRQALGTQALPPNSVLTTLALFLTYFIMSPTLSTIYNDGISPYSKGQIDADTLVARVLGPMRDFMATQIETTRNVDDVYLFAEYSGQIDPSSLQTYDDVPLSVLLPAYILSELRTAFIIGFQLFLPFLVIDMAISSILVSMGMMMLPPVLISLPFKLLLFVLVDGWRLIAQMLLISFDPSSAIAG